MADGKLVKRAKYKTSVKVPGVPGVLKLVFSFPPHLIIGMLRYDWDVWLFHMPKFEEKNNNNNVTNLVWSRFGESRV